MTKCLSINQDKRLTKTVGIVGAGFSGLTLANVLAKHKVHYTLFDQSMSNISISGNLQLPSAQQVMKKLGLPWRQGMDDYVNRNDFLTALRDQIQIRHAIRITQILEKGSKMYCVDNKAKLYGPFDVIIGADGVFSLVRKCSSTRSGITGLIGDARWARDKFWDFGTTRIRSGADLAIRDGIECGLLLLEDQLDLGKFDAKHKRQQQILIYWTTCTLFLILMILTQMA